MGKSLEHPSSPKLPCEAVLPARPALVTLYANPTLSYLRPLSAALDFAPNIIM
jgi:hypothetical protein